MNCIDCDIAKAKALLHFVLTDNNFSSWQPVKAILAAAKVNGISKKAMKIARHEMGAISLTVNGEQYWGDPSRIRR